MAQKNDNPADPFKKALAEATKTMSGDTDLNVTYSVDPSVSLATPCACPKSADA